jgi:hypothetical protein
MLAIASNVRAVQIALAIGEPVVLAVIGDPGDRRPLDGGGPEHRECCSQRPARREAAVREETVEARGHAESRRRT